MKHVLVNILDMDKFGFLSEYLNEGDNDGESLFVTRKSPEYIDVCNDDNYDFSGLFNDNLGSSGNVSNVKCLTQVEDTPASVTDDGKNMEIVPHNPQVEDISSEDEVYVAGFLYVLSLLVFSTILLYLYNLLKIDLFYFRDDFSHLDKGEPFQWLKEC